MKDTEKNCLQCGKIFQRKNWDVITRWEKKKFCSRMCHVVFRTGKSLKKKDRSISRKKICKQCKCEMIKKNSMAIDYWTARKYCSQKCNGDSKIGTHAIGRKKPVWSAEQREKHRLMMLGNKRAYGFSMTKQHRKKIIDRQSGKNSHFWKGGRTRLEKLIRHCSKYKEWRNEIFVRDNYTCKNCGTRGVELHPHHVKAFSLILFENNIRNVDDALLCGELWDTENGISLCVPCHKKTDNYARKGIIF